jgi:hypothetical protein
VADGMNVINLSLGEPEVDPARDIVVRAIDGAAQAGVVPCIAAGNDGENGKGSISSPGSAPLAITAAAATTGRGAAPDIIAGFSSIGPTPYSLQLKPDVAAPGVSVVSSVPEREGTWAAFSGTSMASPHVAGSAALLRQQHATWTVAQIKSALMLTGDPAYVDDARSVQATPLRGGGGRINLVRANAPLLFASPSSVSFGLMKAGESNTISISLADAGGGTGAWAVSFALTQGPPLSVPASVSVPGVLAITASIAAGAAEENGTGFIVLTRGTDVRRIPYWLRVELPKLGKPTRTLVKNGTYSGNTLKGRAAVTTYRYPEPPDVGPLTGPEQVFAVHLKKAVANFGVRIVSQAAGVKIVPRVVRDNDENRLVGYTGLPGDLNPYRTNYGTLVPVVGAILPTRGTYDVVFDTGSRATAGKFRFRLWINDVKPPTVKLRGYARGIVTLAVTDAGASVDTSALRAFVDGDGSVVTLRNGRALVKAGALSAGKHTIRLLVSDYQETKNMEDVLRILPNTRDYRASFKVP